MNDKPDELLQRYADAVAQDERRPSDRVREAVRAHAQMQLARSEPASATVAKPQQRAANRSKWTLPLVASMAMVALTGLLVIQIEHGTPDDREVALGGPTPSQLRPRPAPDSAAGPAVATTANQPQKNAEATTPQPVPTMAAAPSIAIGERRATAVQRPQATAEETPLAKALAPPAKAPVAVEPPAAPAAPILDAAQSVANARYGSADAISNSAAPPSPALAAATGSTQRQRADAATPASLSLRLLAAARNGQVDTMDALLAQGASVNTRDESGNTALMVALGERQVPAARKLLERGADPSLVNREGANALQIAVRMDLPDIVKLLQQPSH